MADEQQQQNNEQYKRVKPQNQLDIQLMFTDGVWGKQEIPPALRSLLNKYYSSLGVKGETIVTKSSLWDMLGYFTRDMRLGNLSFLEMEYCKYYLDLTGDFLQAGQIEPFAICLSRVGTILELSQSKNGFLRRRINTFSQENTNVNLEPPKKALFGGGSQQTKQGGF